MALTRESIFSAFTSLAVKNRDKLISGFDSFLDIPSTEASRAAAVVTAVGANEGGVIQADIGGPVAGVKVQAALAEGFDSAIGSASGLGVTGSLESGREAAEAQKIFGFNRNIVLGGVALLAALLILPRVLKG